LSQLAKWDELEEVIEGGLMTKEDFTAFVNKLDLKNDRLNFEDFKQFIGFLDRVLVEGMDEDEE
jgi:hypothetical protein